MIWIIHRDNKVKDFIENMLDSSEEFSDKSRYVADSFRPEHLGKIKPDDHIFGTMRLGMLFSIKKKFTYHNIVPSRSSKGEYIEWAYDFNLDSDTGQPNCVLSGNQLYKEEE